MDPAWVSLEGSDLLAAGHVPYLHRRVQGAAGQAFAVEAEGHARDPVCVPLEGQNVPATGHVPHLQLTGQQFEKATYSTARLKAAASTAGQQFAVGAKGHTADHTRMSAHGLLILVGQRVQKVVLPAAEVRAALIQVVRAK